MRNMNTSWSKPSTTLLAGINNLRKALAAGYRAKLVRARNEDCSYPILIKTNDIDFRNYEFQIGHAASRTGIRANNSLSDFEKELVLNYVTCYGTPEAKELYYSTGQLSPDNDLGIGTSHLVLATDLIKMLLETQQKQRADLYQRQYTTSGYDDVCHLYNFYRYKHASMLVPRIFKTRVWVVVLLKDNDKMPRIPVMVHVLNTVSYPLKYVPTRSVMRMNEYKIVTYRIGSVLHGFSIEFQVPKRFGFSNTD